MDALREALQLAVGVSGMAEVAPELRRRADLEGLAPHDFQALVRAICESKSGHALAVGAVRLLVPRRHVPGAWIEPMVTRFALLRSPQLRSALCKYLCLLWDVGALTREARHMLHASYAVFFHFIQNERVHDVARLLYRLTRTVDVTPVRCRLLSHVLGKKPNDISLLGLGEVFAALASPETKVGMVFPARENGMPGGSGLSPESRAKVHEKCAKSYAETDAAWAKSIAAKLYWETSEEDADDVDTDGEGEGNATTTTSTRRREALQHSLREGLHPTKRPNVVRVLSSAAWSSLSATEAERAGKRARLVGVDEDEDEDEDRNEEAVNDARKQDFESFVYTHLSVWDGFSTQRQTLGWLARLSFPQSEQDQDMFLRMALRPVLAIIVSASCSFRYHAIRALASLLGNWIRVGEASAQAQHAFLTKHVMPDVENALFATLVAPSADASGTDDPLVQLACVEFYCVLARHWHRYRSALQSPKALCPSERIVQRLLLSPSLVGVCGMAGALSDMVPVFQAAKDAKLAEKFARLVGDFLKVLLGSDCFAAFSDTGGGDREGEDDRVVRELSSLSGRKTVLGLEQSFAFSGLWATWCEEREQGWITTVGGGGDADRLAPPPQATFALFLTWLRGKGASGIAQLAQTKHPKMFKSAVVA